MWVVTLRQELEYREGPQNATFSLTWKPLGEGALVALPIEALWHDPRKTETYEKAP